MPMTEFARMRRTTIRCARRRPATTLAYNSPNACNLCHTNKDAAWSDKFVREWRKRDYQKPVLERAALIAAARKGDWTKLPDMLAYLSNPDREEIQSVSLVRLLANCSAEEKWPVLRKLVDDSSPLVRASAAEALGERLDEANANALFKAAGDDYRLVRVRAAAALARIPESMLPEEQRSRVREAIAELLDSMKSRPDDMSSHYNLGNFHMARGQMPEAVAEFEIATRLQPDALPPYVNAALAYNALGQNDKAEASLRRALSLDATNAPANLNLGMLAVLKTTPLATDHQLLITWPCPPAATSRLPSSASSSWSCSPPQPVPSLPRPIPSRKHSPRWPPTSSPVTPARQAAGSATRSFTRSGPPRSTAWPCSRTRRSWPKPN